MKTIITFVICAISFCSFGQINPPPTSTPVQEQAPRQVITRPTTTGNRVQPAANINAVKAESQSEFQAEVNAKKKSQSQRQTKVQGNGIAPNLTDTLKNPKMLRDERIQKPVTE